MSDDIECGVSDTSYLIVASWAVWYRDGRPRIADSATAFSGNVAQYQRVGRSLGAPLLSANASGLHVFSSRAHPSLAVRADADARHRATGDHEGELRRPPLQVLGRLSR